MPLVDRTQEAASGRTDVDERLDQRRKEREDRRRKEVEEQERWLLER